MSDSHDRDASAADGKRGQKHTAGAFDIRNFIGALLGLYGLILTLLGIFGDKAVRRTGNVNANLYAGIVLLVISAFFIVWAQDQADRRPRARRARRRRPDPTGAEASAVRPLTTRSPATSQPVPRPQTVRTGCGVSGAADRRGRRTTSGS